MSKTIQAKFKVMEAYTRDVRRSVIRVDYDTMDQFCFSTGDIVLVKGKRNTYCKALPLYPSDEGKQLVRVDALVRQNAGIVIGDYIHVDKAKKVSNAVEVHVEPAEGEEIPTINEKYLADAMDSIPIIKKDTIKIPYFGGYLTFVIKETKPSGHPVIVRQNTVFRIIQTYDPSKKPKRPTTNSPLEVAIKKTYKPDDISITYNTSDSTTMYDILKVVKEGQKKINEKLDKILKKLEVQKPKRGGKKDIE